MEIVASCLLQLASLQQSRVTHIVCIRQEIEANFVRPNFPDHFKWVTVVKWWLILDVSIVLPLLISEYYMYLFMLSIIIQLVL